ncbi:TetR/AcrR family transcriptional regulator [Saccharopolyspora spinosa]|uniref:TetR family transcriptional regulator n=1 Tax=Saccharopolyspora spinosa TaxID=60894 RepID=A0A2N3Y669_SACSN|nr:TetR/AcrR family transcriptional regulator [Saccharopolyspora spinosa]PKW18432.1 TetR family transcriptional regulator [Saccharopolyspora spinosa]
MSPAGKTLNRGGRPPRLSQNAIVDVGERILVRDGIEALTMRRVAKELGSSPMAVYRHVQDKDELLVLILDRLVARLPRPELPDNPQDRLIELWKLLHGQLIRHPWAIEVLAAGDMMAPSVLWIVEEILATFVKAGLDRKCAAAAYRAVWHFTLGEALVRTATRRRTDELDRPPFAIVLVSDVDREQMPNLACLSDQWSTARETDSYPEGLKAMITGWLSST